MTTKPDGGHAYPTNAYRYDESGNAIPIVGPGMTLRQHAAIQLCVPDSGEEWLDDMIRARMRDDMAVQAMQSLLSSDAYNEGLWPNHELARCAYNMALAMLFAREKRG